MLTIVVSGVESACTRLPIFTRCRLTRPSIGDVTCVNSRFRLSRIECLVRQVADMVAPSVSGLFKWRQFEPEIILMAVGWYLRLCRDQTSQRFPYGLRHSSAYDGFGAARRGDCRTLP